MSGLSASEAETGKSPDPLVARRFGLPMGIFVVVSSMIGVGILTTSGFTVASVGSNQLMLLLWIVGGVLALCGALCVAELASALPSSGGDYIYLYEAYGPLPAFLTGWVSFLIGFAGPIAASAFASASYLLAPLSLPPAEARLAQQAAASLAIIAFALIHTSKASYAAGAHFSVTLLKLGILGAFALAGLYAGWGHWQNLADRPAISLGTASSMLFSLVYISYGYTGWNAASYLAGEIDDPGRKLPKAILVGTSLVVALYLALNTVYALALTAGDIQQIVKDRGFDAVQPIGELAAKRLFGPNVSAGLSVAFGLTLLASLSAYVLTGPQVAVAMARAGHFPPIASRLSARTGAPVIATVLQVVWALLLLWLGTFEKILIYASVGLAIFSMLSVSTVIVLRHTRPELHRPFRVPAYPLVPVVFLVGTTLLTIAAFIERPWPSLFALLTILAGVPVYYIMRWQRARASSARSE